LVTWGNNLVNQCSDTPVGVFKQIACGNNHSVAIEKNGTLVIWGDNRLNQCSDIPVGDVFTHIACGYNHSVAIYDPNPIIEE
jgi:alpha-tubulin suppressor-like RCC1 family protein